MKTTQTRKTLNINLTRGGVPFVRKTLMIHTSVSFVINMIRKKEQQQLHLDRDLDLVHHHLIVSVNVSVRELQHLAHHHLNIRTVVRHIMVVIMTMTVMTLTHMIMV